MQPVRATIHFVARNEFDNGMVGILLLVALHLQPYPFGGRLIRKAQ